VAKETELRDLSPEEFAELALHQFERLELFRPGTIVVTKREHFGRKKGLKGMVLEQRTKSFYSTKVFVGKSVLFEDGDHPTLWGISAYHDEHLIHSLEIVGFDGDQEAWRAEHEGKRGNRRKKNASAI
jgi:hypothetical protein